MAEREDREAQREVAGLGAAFALGGDLVAAQALGHGLIHRTYLARYAGGAAVVYQQLNAAVFPDLPGLMRNVLRITAHLARALRARGVRDAARRCLEVVATAGGEPLHVDAAGRAWRAFRYLEATRSLDVLSTPAEAYATARAFGEFAALLADLPAAELVPTIPRFHDAAARAEAFEAAVRDDPLARAAAAAREIDALRRQGDALRARLEAAGGAALPLRVAHHDCKVNNLLLDAASGEALCVVDLDTTMPGTLLSDFGELVRSGTTTARDDERDLARVRFDEERFAALARGYVAGAGPILDAGELASLHLAGPLLTWMNGVRFLTDHLLGDVYFRTRRPGQNLDRARTHLQLLERMREAEDRLRACIEQARTP